MSDDDDDGVDTVLRLVFALQEARLVLRSFFCRSVVFMCYFKVGNLLLETD